VQLVLRVTQVLKVFKVLQDPFLTLLVRRDPQVQLVFKDPLDLKVFRVNLVLRVQQVPQVLTRT
jgi:hypothetical protein